MHGVHVLLFLWSTSRGPSAESFQCTPHTGMAVAANLEPRERPLDMLLTINCIVNHLEKAVILFYSHALLCKLKNVYQASREGRLKFSFESSLINCQLSYMNSQPPQGRGQIL